MPFSPTPPEGPVTLSNNARTVLEKRYLVKDKTGKPVESPRTCSGAWRRWSPRRIARYGASDGAVQALAEEFYFLMTQRRFEPNSPTLMNAGRPLGQLSRVLRAAGRGCALQRAERHLRHAAQRWRSSIRAAAARASASRACAARARWCAPRPAWRRGPSRS